MQVCTSLQADNHASTPPLSFLQAGCPSCHPTNSVIALKAQPTLPCNLSLMAGFAGIDVSQGSVATCARCGGIFTIHLTTNSPRNLPAKIESVKI